MNKMKILFNFIKNKLITLCEDNFLFKLVHKERYHKYNACRTYDKLNDKFLEKKSESYIGRFREILMDPLNLFIERDLLAGTIKDNNIKLHNGIVIPISSYYGSFSDILIINRGVHEPLEEFLFQETLKKIEPLYSSKNEFVMLELGSYWAHYSMWLKKTIPHSVIYCVEPDQDNLEIGKNNFLLNNLALPSFINDIVDNGNFEIDAWIKNNKIKKINFLHSDIQGYELKMLEGADLALREKLIDMIFVSTHSQEIHHRILNIFKNFDYRIEASSDVDFETTSHDGLIFCTSPNIKRILPSVEYMGRTSISKASSEEILNYVEMIKANFDKPS